MVEAGGVAALNGFGGLPRDSASLLSSFVEFVLDEVLDCGLGLRASFVHDVGGFACHGVGKSAGVLALFAHVFETRK